MDSTREWHSASRLRLADLVTVTKPTITATSTMMAAGGIALAPGEPSAARVAALLVGTTLVVGAANTLNMYWERESDKLMNRTRNRPLPSGRMSATTALCFGIALGVAGALTLWVGANALVAMLGLFGVASYVLAYTPLKRRSPAALWVGAIPGAVPPVIGWAGIQGEIGTPALALFALLFLWQVPHFLGLAVWKRADYARAGLKTVAVVHEEHVARGYALACAGALVATSLALVPLHLAGPIYFVAASALGLWLFAAALARRADWGRRLFFSSLIYLPALILALAIDRVIPV